MRELYGKEWELHHKAWRGCLEGTTAPYTLTLTLSQEQVGQGHLQHPAQGDQ